MIKVLAEEMLEQAVELSWRLCQSVSTRSYPLFQSKQAIRKAYLMRQKEEHGELLGCFSGKALIGVCAFFVIPSDTYLQTVAFYIERDYPKTITEFLDYLKENYPDYSVNIGLPFENTAVAGALEQNGFDLAEDSFDMRLDLNDFTCSGRSKEPALRLTADRYAEYKKFHDLHFPDIYWNAQRLLSDIARWRIFVHLRDGKIDGGIFVMPQSKMAEIFGLWAPDAEIAGELLCGSIQAVTTENTNIGEIIFFVEEDETHNLNAAEACGFCCAAHYQLWSSKTHDA